MPLNLQELAHRHRTDRDSVYHSWFVDNESRSTAFHAIPRGVKEVVSAIEEGTFGCDFKGSPLEPVLACITEQKQVFEGAAHAFYWKPKLGIPDIYLNEGNKAAFGRFLENCLDCSSAKQIVDEIEALDRMGIKGLGPAVANILYFLHPTLMPPFNTAIVKGFNTVFGARIKLGSWPAYLEMRDMIVRANETLQPVFPEDLGAISGLLYDAGKGNISLVGLP